MDDGTTTEDPTTDSDANAEAPDEAVSEPEDLAEESEDRESGTGEPASETGGRSWRDPSLRPDPAQFHRWATGMLTLHYPERDIAWQIDADAALRIIALCADRNDPGLEDELNIGYGYQFPWLVIDRRRLIAATWVPGASVSSDRVTVDPVLTSP